MKVRGQSALDYLMSWGWVLIVIAAALIVLYSLGIFSVSSSPTIISGFPTVSVSGAVANSSLMIFKLVNNFGSTINLSNIAVSVNGKNYSSLDCEKTILPQGQTSLCRVPVSITSGKYLASVAINFLPYRSVVQLTSNGTVSASLYKGALALNNVNTLFYAYNAPVGQTWSVSFGGVLKSETISPSAAGHILNFSMPFGTYNYNVSNLSSSCSGAFPVPSKGTVSAGALYKIGYSGNCVTTFIESGIPSPFNWEVNYSDPLSRTAPAGSSISFLVPVNTTSVYRAVPLSLACANTSNVAIPAGGTVHISYWECNTTLSESGIPLGATGNGISGTLGWTASFNGAAPSSTSASSFTIPQTVSTISAQTASATVNGLSCSGASSASIYEGSSNTFNSWHCNTTLSQNGLLTKNDVTISSDTTLTGNLIVGGNLTIGPNVQLTTNGYMILVGGTLTFALGASINTGTAPGGQNFSSSYGGSGGGSGNSAVGSTELSGTNGYSTLALGGSGGYGPGGNGATPAFPSLNPSTLINLLSLGDVAAFSGAGGGTSCNNCNGYGQGGPGAYGLYIQASNIISDDIFNGAYVININAGGSAGGSGGSYTKNGVTYNIGGGGGGGGGIVIFATRSSENIASNYIITSGGAGGLSGGGSSNAGGSGGGGGFYTYQYSTPPVQIPVGNWSASNNGAQISVNTSTPLVFTDDTFSNIAPTSFSVHSDSLACANTTSVYSGGSSTVSLWNCTDQYTEEGLPSGGTWNVSFSGKSYMASTGTPIKISSALVTTTYATTGFRTANAQSDNLDCHDNGIFQIFQGSNSTVNPWYCVTSFSESGIDFNAVGWTVYFNNNNIFSTSYQSSGSVNQTGIVTVSPEPMYSDVNGLNCHSADTFQVTPGSSAPQFNSWTCITTFSGFPGQFTFSYPNLPPQSFESTIYPTNTKVVNAYSLSTTSSTLTVSSTNSVVGPSVYMTGSVAPHSNATSISYTYQSQANTNSGSSYSFTANGSTAIFAVSVGVPYYNDVVTIGLPSGCSELSYEYNSMAQNEGTNHDVVFNQVNECNTTPGDTYTFTVSNSGSNGEVVAAGFVSYPFNPSYYHFAYNPTNSDHPSNSASPLDCTTEQTNWTFSTQTSSGVPGMFVGAVASGGQTPTSTNNCESAYFSASQTVHSKDSANYEGDISWAAFLTQSYIPNTLWSYISDQNENLLSPDSFAWGTAASMVSALAMPENLTSVHSDIGTTTSAFNISAGGTVNVAYTPWGYSAFS